MDPTFLILASLLAGTAVLYGVAVGQAISARPVRSGRAVYEGVMAALVVAAMIFVVNGGAKHAVKNAQSSRETSAKVGP